MDVAARAVNLNLSSECFVRCVLPVAMQVMVSDNSSDILLLLVRILWGLQRYKIPLLIRFSSSESLTDWTPYATNSAGDLRIGTGSKFVTAVENKA